MKEYKPTVFNTNVLKDVVFAMTQDEQEVEENKVKDLAKFILDTGMQTLIRTLSKNENIPTDSASLRDTFHQSGLNIRYLGKVADEIKDKSLTHMKYLLEREVIVRCFKHILNKYLKNCTSEELLSETVCHIFNIFFAPKDFIKRLDEGSIKFSRESLKSVAEKQIINNSKEKIEVVAGTAKVEAEVDPTRQETPSRRAKKDRKRAAKDK